MSTPVTTTNPTIEAAPRGLDSSHGPDQEASTDQGLLRAVVYLRVSTTEQAETTSKGDGYSIPAQREAAEVGSPRACGPCS